MSMETEIVYGEWIIIDGEYGVSLYPSEYFTADDAMANYGVIGCNIYEIDNVSGYCARLTMPGFLDSTEWQGPYGSEREAMRDLEKIFDLKGAFLSETDSRETSEELLATIWDISCEMNPGDVYRTADAIWHSPGDLMVNIVERVTNNHAKSPKDYYWGAAGNNWAED